jgi:hypothetical protein
MNRMCRLLVMWGLFYPNVEHDAAKSTPPQTYRMLFENRLHSSSGPKRPADHRRIAVHSGLNRDAAELGSTKAVAALDRLVSRSQQRPHGGRGERQANVAKAK